MEIIKNPTQDEIKKAAKALMDGHLVAFPTETVYGLGADATNEEAVSRVYAVKGRPTDHPLIVHISSINQLDKWATDIPGYAIKLAKEFWPGPMTLILKRSELAKDFVTGSQESVGLRVPSNSVSLKLLAEFEELGGQGIAAPSANRFGAVSPTSKDDVMEELELYLNTEDQVLDGGKCPIGIESTIIDCTNSFPQVIRPGVITLEMVTSCVSIFSTTLTSNYQKKMPGTLDSHYAPKAQVNLWAEVKSGDGFIALSNVPTPDGAIRLISPNDLEEFARDLYEALRLADAQKIMRISVVLPEGNGLAIAIRDRLIKSSAGTNSKK
jgi:L-threonylcarbamoyladenylate synthase